MELETLQNQPEHNFKYFNKTNLKKNPNEMVSLSIDNNKNSIKQLKNYHHTKKVDVIVDMAEKITDNIYIVDNNKKNKLLKHTAIRDYIFTICRKMKVEHLDADKITNNVYPKLKKINTIKEVEDLIVMCASEMVTDHYDYPCIATWILINNLHENTHSDYLQVARQLFFNINKKGKKAPIVSEKFMEFVEKNYKEINVALHYERDYDISVFGFRTLEKAYLKKIVGGKIVERPQHMYMRVAIALHYRTNRMERIIETYELLSNGYFTHATPTLFNAGTTHEQLSSCFLLGIGDDMEEIGECWKDCAIISKYAGGIGINISNIRVDGAYIHSTQGTASGLRLLLVFNQIARYADQGGKRAGSIAMYIEPWHGDVFFFLDLKKNTGAETERARDLFLALMINDIFMKRVEENGVWSLMCPSECPDLLNKYGEEFTRIYEKYESEGKFLRQIPARDLWFRIMESQIETGVPYIVFKDAVNYKSNQINIGVINGSNLCVSGDTKILTSNGYKNIKSLENQQVDIWNGEEFSNIIVKKTGINQQMMEIKFSNGSTLKCTPYHKFYLTDDARNQKIIKVQASDLEIGDKLIKTKYPIIEKGKNDFKYPYTHGLFCTDRTHTKLKNDPNQFENDDKYQAMFHVDHPILTLYGEKRELFQYLEIEDCQNMNSKSNSLLVRLNHSIAKKFTVPINYDLDIKLKWLAGLLDGDGCVCKNGSYKSLQIDSIDKKFLNDVKYMLQTMGCDPKVTVATRAEQTLMPDDGGDKMYNKKICYQLLINSTDTYHLVELGLETHLLNLNDISNEQPTALPCFVTVTKITNLKEKEDTYCFNESKRHMGIFNGIVSGNCSEIVQVSSSEEYAVCFTENTEIITKNGVKKIIDCDNEDVLSYYDNDVNLNKHQHYEKARLINNGIKTVYALKTNGNRVIEATSDHPFLILENVNRKNHYKWKKLEDLKIGDKIVTPQIDTITKFKISKKNFVDKYLNYGQSVNHSEINQNIRVGSPLEQASFLSGYFSTNGNINLHENEITIDLDSITSSILYDIQSMLIQFGISSKINSEEKTLSICGKTSVNNFKKYINFGLSQDKKKKLKSYISKYNNSEYSNYSNVISIEKIGQKNVYDLILNNSHNFIANGHVAHNCNLASICLPKFIDYVNGKPVYNYQKLYQIARVVTRNLNSVIDINFYPVEKTRISNMKNRPIGIGVQGLADVFALFKTPFDSELARDLNKKIFETIYFASLTESVSIAKEEGPYQTFVGSPTSQGKFQFDLWGLNASELSGIWDWESLRKDMVIYGIRNSLLTTCMPTASTSQIMNNNETCEAYTENIYTRSTLAGDYYIINKYLMKDLMELKLWDSDMVDLIKYYKGSIANIPTIPDHIKKIYRTVWEIPQKSIIEMAADRGPFIDQTQSMNLFINKPNFAKLNSCLMYGWKKGLKTGIYYLRSKAASDANQFGIDIDKIKKLVDKYHIEQKIEETKKSSVKIEKEMLSCKYIPKYLRKTGDCDVCSS